MTLTPEHYAALLDRDAALRRAEMAEEVAEIVAKAARLFKQAALISLDRATQAEQRERTAAEASNGQQQSYRELEALYQAERFKNIRQDEARAQLMADNAALREAITSFLTANTYSTIGTARAKLRQLVRDAYPGQALLAELAAARKLRAAVQPLGSMAALTEACAAYDAVVQEKHL